MKLRYTTNQWNPIIHENTTEDALKHRIDINRSFVNGNLEQLQNDISTLAHIVAKLLNKLEPSEILEILDFEEQ